MVKAHCDFCASFNDGPFVHAQSCPHVASYRVSWRGKATETFSSSPQDMDLQMLASQNKGRHSQMVNEGKRNLNQQSDKRDDLNASPTFLHAFQSFVSQKDPTGPKDPTVNVYFEGESGCLRLTQSGVLEEAKRNGRPLCSPEIPCMEITESRRDSFKRGTSLVQQSQVQQCVDNGFYKADDFNVKCFHCGICFREENFEDTSWNIGKEHARWSPFCGYLQHIYGKESGILSDVNIPDVNCEQG